LALDSNYGKIEPGERNDPIQDDKYGMRDDMYINVFSFLREDREKDIGRGRGRKWREYRVLLGIQVNTKLKSCLGCYYAAGEEFLPYGFLAASVIVMCCDVIRKARMGSSDLLVVCLLARFCSFQICCSGMEYMGRKRDS
jgi:hypothetical protein